MTRTLAALLGPPSQPLVRAVTLGLLLFWAAPGEARQHDRGPAVGPAGASPFHLNFRRLTPDEGMPAATVYCILQDSRGFLWFGTGDGLARYDGYEFRVFRHDPADPDSLANDVVLDILEDGDGDLWLATDGGLYRWNLAAECLEERHLIVELLPDRDELGIGLPGPTQPAQMKSHLPPCGVNTSARPRVPSARQAAARRSTDGDTVRAS